jgi:hypothetical protein
MFVERASRLNPSCHTSLEQPMALEAMEILLENSID